MAAAAALPIAFGTAHHCLFARGGLKRGETVLIQAGAGGVGLAAIQLAQRQGATVLATVSGVERAERLVRLGLDHAIDHRSAEVVDTVMRLTEGRGADLVVDPVGTTLQGSLAALCPRGAWSSSATPAVRNSVSICGPRCGRTNRFFGVFMGTQLEKPDVYLTVSRMLELAATGDLRVIVDRTFPLAAAAEAHAYAEGNSVLGRVVIASATQ